MGREAGLQSRIAKHLRACGWFAQVEHGNAYTGRGRSDLIVCAHGHFIAIEVKTMDDDSKTTPPQDKYLADVRAAGGAAFVARSVKEAERGVRAALETPMPSDLDDLIAQLDAAAPSISPPTAVATTPAPVAVEDENELTDFFSPAPAAAPAADDDLSRALLRQTEAVGVTIPEVEILMQPVLNQTSVIPFETVEAAFESVPPERLAEATKPKAGVPASGDRLDRLCDLLEQLVGAVQALIDQTVTAEPTRKPRAAKVKADAS